MKILKTASGSQIKLSKSEWETIGRTAGWMKSAELIQTEDGQLRWAVDFLTPNPTNDPVQTLMEIAKAYNKALSPGLVPEITDHLKDSYDVDMRKMDLNDTSNIELWDTIIHVVLGIGLADTD